MPVRERDMDSDAGPSRARAVRIRTGVVDNVGGMDTETAIAALHDLTVTWGVTASETPEEKLQRALSNFRVNGNSTVRSISDRCLELETSTVALFHQLRTLACFTSDREGAALLQRMESVLEQIFHAKNAAVSLVQACRPPTVSEEAVEGEAQEEDAQAKDLDARLTAWGVKFRWRATVGGEELTPVQELIMYMFDVSSRYGFRRYGTDIFEPVYVDTFNTRAFRRLCSVKEFVYDARFTGKDFNYEIFLKLTGGAQNAKSVITYLENTNDRQLPVLIRDRTVFSFTNGIYMARENTFAPYSTAMAVPDDVVSAKFFPHEFPARYVDLDDWRHIPTPEIDSILVYQELPPDVIEWFYAILGRMIYSLRDGMDKWQVMPFLFGAAGKWECDVCNVCWCVACDTRRS